MKTKTKMQFNRVDNQRCSSHRDFMDLFATPVYNKGLFKKETGEEVKTVIFREGGEIIWRYLDTGQPVPEAVDNLVRDFVARKAFEKMVEEANKDLEELEKRQ